MNGKLLLDTNIVIAIFAGDIAVKTSLANANEVFVPGIALGGLYYGAHKSSRVEGNSSICYGSIKGLRLKSLPGVDP